MIKKNTRKRKNLGVYSEREQVLNELRELLGETPKRISFKKEFFYIPTSEEVKKKSGIFRGKDPSPVCDEESSKVKTSKKVSKDTAVTLLARE